MFLLQATMAPIVAQLADGRRLAIPKMTMDDISTWAAHIQEEEVSRYTQDMSEDQKREYLVLYPPTSPNFANLRHAARTPAGVRFILRNQLPKATVTNKDGSPATSLSEAEIAAIVAFSPSSLEQLAMALADLFDTSKVVPPNMQNDKGDKSEDPSKP